MTSIRTLLLALGLVGLGSCQSIYYSTMAQFGVEKRDILLDRTEGTAEAMSRLAQRIEEMQSTYHETIHLEGGDLPKQHKLFSKAYGRAEDAAGDFHGQIEDMQSVAALLFEEWKDKSSEITDPDLRRQSMGNFGRAQTSFTDLVRTLRNVEAAMDPLLTRYHDHVVFLKLNLHRMTLESLQDTEEELLSQTDELAVMLQDAIEDTRTFADLVDY